MQNAYSMVECADAKRGLERLHRELMDLNPSAARCLEEGMEETITLHRLRVPEQLRRRFVTTNVSLLVAERQFRKVIGFRQLDHYPENRISFQRSQVLQQKDDLPHESSGEVSSRPIPSPRFLGASILLILASFAIVWHFGHRGLMPLDFSINLDGGYRILRGQVMYKDFFAAYLPGTLWLQALFFKLFGVSVTSMVIPAAILNAVGTAITLRIIWLLLPGQELAALAGGLGTCIWFQAPCAILQHEQAAFAFGLIGLWMLLETGRRRADFAIAFLAGLLLFAAILCKQNAGIPFVPVALLLVILPDWAQRRNWLIVLTTSAGLVCGLGLFLSWVHIYSDWNNFVTHAIKVPSSFGLARIFANKLTFANALTLQNFTFPTSLASLFSLVVAAIIVPLTWKKGIGLDGSVALFTVALHLFSSFFCLTAFNQQENGLPFLGLAFGLSFGLLLRHFRNRDLTISLSAAGPSRTFLWRSLWFVIFAIPAALFLLTSVYGWRTGYLRLVHDFNSSTNFSEMLNIPGAALVWGQPTLVRTTEMQKEDLEATYRYLAESPGNFFVFAEATMLYGLTGRVSPQPVLFFLEGHSYRAQDTPQLDRLIVASLRRNGVNILVREKACRLIDCARELESFPLLAEWMSEFRPVRQFGFFEILEKPAD